MTRGSGLTSMASPRTTDGRLWFTNRALATTLLGMTAMLPPDVAMCVERQFTWTTWPSMPPSTQAADGHVQDGQDGREHDHPGHEVGHHLGLALPVLQHDEQARETDCVARSSLPPARHDGLRPGPVRPQERIEARLQGRADGEPDQHGQPMRTAARQRAPVHRRLRGRSKGTPGSASRTAVASRRARLALTGPRSPGSVAQRPMEGLSPGTEDAYMPVKFAGRSAAAADHAGRGPVSWARRLGIAAPPPCLIALPAGAGS